MFSDIINLLIWWLVIFLIGLAFFPLTNKIFNKFFDKGYLFSKVIGIVFSSYFIWLLASLKIMPFSQNSILLVLAIGIIVNIIIVIKKFSPLTSHFSSRIFIYIAEELMFFLTLAFWSYIRGFQPDIQGLEKFMDFGFVNSILRSNYFPPVDMWFAGKGINYYYFGHFITAFLTKFTGISSAITYNLMIATLFAFCFSLTFSLTGNLIYISITNKIENWKIGNSLRIGHWKLVIIGGLFSALLISLGANLHPAFYNLKMSVFKKPYCDGSFSYWYPNATRYIGYCPDVSDKTIHEFPAYSFIVSDLHGHVSDIPVVLTILASILILYIKIKEDKKLTFPRFLSSTFHLPLLFGITYMANQWDFPIYLMVLGFALLLSYFQVYGKSITTLIRTITSIGIILILVIPLILSFQLNFESLAKGIDFVHATSLFYQLLILWGGPWFFGLTFLFFLFRHKTKFISDYFVLIIFLVSTILIVIPEIIYLKDIYISSYHRANTMFKLTYQSFMMFSIGIGYIFVRVISSLKKGLTRFLLFTIYCLLIITLLVYPNYSIKGYYGNINTSNYKGLYGLNFLDRLYPDDYQAVLWLNKNISGQPVVLEAVGDSYTDFERISMATGLPTIEGWLVHEWLWRGSFDEPGKRASEVQTIYESKDIDSTKEILNKYQVKYVVIGEMERQKYPNINENKFSKIGKEVFKSGKTTIYEII